MSDLISKDTGWKLFSLALALAIWFTVKNVSNEPVAVTTPLGVWDTRTLTNLPVLVVSAAADVREVKVQPNYVTITVSGRPEVLNGLQEKEIEAHVNLTDLESAPRGVRKRVIVSAPPGVAFVRAEPADVEVVIPLKKK